MAHWHDIPTLTVLGRAMLANTMIYSRFRYWAQTMHMPTDIGDALDADVQALIWGKDPEFDQEALGTTINNNKWLGARSQYLPLKEGGLSLLHWSSHQKALSAMIWFRYRDGTDSTYKFLLDQWVGSRFHEARGAPFTTTPTAALLSSLTNRKPALPPFYRKSLQALKSLTLTPIHPGRFTTQDEARAEPVWCSHRISIRNRQHERTWREQFECNRLQDFVILDDDSPRDWETNEIKAYLQERVAEFNEEALKFFRWKEQYQKLPIVTVSSLTRQWISFCEDIGRPCITATYSNPTPLTDQRYSKQACRMMRKLGWWGGGGLGSSLEGIVP